MPRMSVIPQGLQLDAMAPPGTSSAGPSEAAAAGEREEPASAADSARRPGGPTLAGEPPVWQEIGRFLGNARKPCVLAIARPDPKKNLVAVVEAFGRCRPLRELANLVLVMGNRDSMADMAPPSAAVLRAVLKAVDDYDLYGSCAYPKHHQQEDIRDIYSYAASTRGVFINAALQEPFGLTLIEAASAGVPTVATCNGGPVDIHRTLRVSF